jgi:glycosyltransferase involved in cell wall biosynthesis
MPIDYKHELTRNAKGGTELMAEALESRLDPKLLERFQIVPSRVRNLDESKFKIFWAHDLPGDPESEFLRNGGYNKFDRLVFVSNWQMQHYINHYGIPWYKCNVIQNAIVPIEQHEKPDHTKCVNFIYHTTPHRGLNILVPVFAELAKKYGDKIHLDVYSSFKVYGWEERDAPYKKLFDDVKQHDNMTYHGAVPNSEIREALKKAHSFAYPSIWAETSCIALIEAMSAGLLCIHPNYAALYETAANWTWMYQFNEDQRDHAVQLYGMMDGAIEAFLTNDKTLLQGLQTQKSYMNRFYDWELRAIVWDSLLRSILQKNKVTLD